MLKFRALFVLLVAAWPVAAQDPAAGEVPPAPEVSPERTKNIERLRTLMPAFRTAQADLKMLEQKLAEAVTDDEKAEIAKDVAAQRERVAQLRENFLTIATGVEESRYLRQAREEATWEQNLEDIIAPISRGMRDMTAGAREMEDLRVDLEDWQERQELAEAATKRVATLVDLSENEDVRKELEDAQKLWDNRLAEATSQTAALRQQIEERENKSPSTWEAVSAFFADFWRSRGLHLILALGAAVVVFVFTRRSHRLVRRASPFHRKGGHNFGARVVDLAWAAAAIFLALGAVVLVFYLQGDWLLLALTILFILGLLWASKTAVPPYLEQLRLILNLGPVRQGERMVYEGIPWRVDRLNFYCEFRNPALGDAILRLPVRDVMPLHSRPMPPKEQWFPTTENDWVILGDGTYGKVILQSPEQVVVLRLGGSLKTYPTCEFLSQTPENLSRGFRINVTFGIDYQHQPVCTTEVPGILQQKIEAVLVERVDQDHLRSLKVAFASAGTSSLDYAVLADFDGDVAPRYNFLERLINQVCVDACNEHGWVIPFTQITVHEAPPAPDATG